MSLINNIIASNIKAKTYIKIKIFIYKEES